MKQAYIISTGNELLTGDTIDSNSVFLSQKLTDIAIKVVGKSIVGDDSRQLRAAFLLGIETADIVISTGGLGPTFDDLTRNVACEIMGCNMEMREDEAEKIREYFRCRNRNMPKINLKQAMFPPEAIVLANKKGTAAGMYLQKENKTIILLPGPPREMKAMYINEVENLLKRDKLAKSNQSVSRTIKIFGPGESQVEELLGDIINNNSISKAILAKEGEVYIKIEAEAQEKSQEIIDNITAKIVNCLGISVWGYDDDNLLVKLGEMLLKENKKIAFAESCTGGLLSRLITDIPGSSNYFWGSVTSYSNEAKKFFLGVKEETLDTYGAVSRETAEEMAMGILKASGADIGLSITGIAGPGGGTDKKPVGLVYIGIAEDNYCNVRELRFPGDREWIRILSAKTAIDMVRRQLLS